MGVARTFAVSVERADKTEGGRARALRAISELGERRAVYAAESGLWAAVVVAEIRDAAIDVIRTELDAIDSAWTEVLTLSEPPAWSGV